MTSYYDVRDSYMWWGVIGIHWKLWRISRQTTKALRAGYTRKQILRWACTQVFTVCEKASDVCNLSTAWSAWLNSVLSGSIPEEVCQRRDNEKRAFNKALHALSGLDFKKSLKNAGLVPNHNFAELDPLEQEIKLLEFEEE